MSVLKSSQEIREWVREEGNDDGNENAEMHGMLRLSNGLTHVVCYGHEGPVTVLLHGNVGSALYLTSLARALCAMKRRVIVFDFYGRGYSDCPASPVTTSVMVGQVAEVLLTLGISEVDLVGYSVGGQVASHFAASHPCSLRKLVLIAPAVEGPPSWLSYIMRMMPLTRWAVGNAMRCALTNKDVWAGDWVHLASPDMKRKEESARLLRELWPLELERLHFEPIATTFGEAVAYLSWSDYTPFRIMASNGVMAKTSIVWGEKDKICGNIHAVIAKMGIRQSSNYGANDLHSGLSSDVDSIQVDWFPRVHILEGEGHSLPYESPTLVAKLVQEILRD